MKHPAISIVMPAYNAENYISEAIKSVLEQSFGDFEFIIIDDGSTDNTVSIIRSYSDERIILFENRHDFIASLNLGINQSQGKYIARMDADDRMFSDRLKIQYEIMETHPDIIVCSSWVQLFNSSSTGEISKSEAGYIDFPMLKLLNNTIVYHPTTMMKKEFLVRNHIQYEYYPYAEDYRLWFQIAQLGGIFYTEPQPLLYYRISENQISYVFGKEQQETALRIKCEILDFLITQNKAAYPELPTIYKNLLELSNNVLINHEYIIPFFSFLIEKIICGKENKLQKKDMLPVFEKQKVKNKITKTILISVIMPVYNMADFVLEAIESILNQSFGNFEFIIIDDASTDSTKNILDSVKDIRIVRINNPVREGNYKSRNKGLNICRGKYVCVMDADDISYPNRIEKQYYFMENNPQYAATGTDIKFFSENSFPTPFQHLHDERKIKVQLLQDNVCTHSSLILRKDVLCQYNIRYKEEYGYPADYNLMVDLTQGGNITNIPEFLLLHRNHREQISSMKDKTDIMYHTQIQLRQVQNFKMRPTVDEFIIHHHLMNGLPLSKDQLDNAEKWCNKLLVRNHKLNIYDEDCLFSFLKECFLKVIQKMQ